MINKEQLISDLDRSTEDLIQQLLKCHEENFNRAPAENCWSAAQVAEHILLLETRVNYALQKAEATERQIDLKIISVKKALDNLERKFVAPDFIIPSTDHKERQQLIDGLRQQREILKQIIETSDLTQTPTYKHPVVGDMTRLEWIYFNIHHSDRHIKQLQNIASHLQ